jgi:hypothetical protein
MAGYGGKGGFGGGGGKGGPPRSLCWPVLQCSDPCLQDGLFAGLRRRLILHARRVSGASPGLSLSVLRRDPGGRIPVVPLGRGRRIRGGRGPGDASLGPPLRGFGGFREGGGGPSGGPGRDRVPSATTPDTHGVRGRVSTQKCTTHVERYHTERSRLQATTPRPIQRRGGLLRHVQRRHVQRRHAERRRAA